MTSIQAARLAYDVVEPSNNDGSELSPIIMLHGLGDTRHTWKSITEELAKKTGRKVYALDARNHGDSEWKNELHFQGLAHDLINFMKQQGIDSAVMVGHSMGGKTALAVATKEPKKVEKLIIEDISNRDLQDKARQGAYENMKLLKKSLDIIPAGTDLEKAKKIVWDFVQSHRTPDFRSISDMSAVLPLQKTADGFSWKLNMELFGKEFLPPRPENVIEGSYEGPALFVYGTASYLNVADDKDIILKAFPNATFKAFEGATHRVHGEFPKEFLDTLVDFLK